ncbi:MAG: hypothetical protein ACFB21_14975 [Opitutales bacterium]
MKEFYQIRQNQRETPRRCFTGGGARLYVWGCGSPGEDLESPPTRWELELPSGRVLRASAGETARLFERDLTRAPFGFATSSLLRRERIGQHRSDRRFLSGNTLRDLPEPIRSTVLGELPPATADGITSTAG